MKLATLRVEGSTAAARIDGGNAVLIEPYPSLSDLLRDPHWHRIATEASGQVVDLGAVEYAPVVTHPTKIVCVGLNYANHIEEMGRELPRYPTLFAKFPEALIGAYDDIHVPAYADQQVDWEGELAVVIGKKARSVQAADAGEYIAGFAVANDVTMRDYQYRTQQWLQGKTFEGTCPLGPTLVTPDEFSLGATLNTLVDGATVQSDLTGDLVFTPARLIEYISHIVTLQAGDVILTGTPGGVGHPTGTHLSDGQTLTTEITGLGTLRNTVCVAAPVPVG
ncbi:MULTISPECIES: fumarylacetoacetate hydrolase family protein [Rhodococcus]|uniref:fumarylacetoacetate hydrolase family protein n=1 Tax=Rhodococcus TaxID=1827 RepID=UPI0002A25508|nr:MULTISPECIES: fumarylacetoacetate hydrolase family protein [Rhodococcus]ELB91816.1 fumarylacetoacetate hydrolase family protein [Rhodococcus wratislaviensis IFP 2016]NHU43729.1 fumarylacetoacetate hydrolase family protein [Rhodococcus sp. A14]MDI9939647.1 fumarylacetoacetate hydrolase family protein [Rhodococcus sp. IEGM 1351]MDI9948004.1 fumarylacetoacetate hydrolase family protein [Rhodococcus sp. IEGM 1305]MDI9974317.1 fumarylacetoacetate hydrolase family protein [Rhodococcus sp. IEGM 13